MAVLDMVTVIGVLAVFAALLSMTDYRQVRARIRQRLVPVGLPLLLMAGVFIGALWLGHRDPPPLSAVNGVYVSACCAPVELKNGMLVTSTLHIPFKLQMEKAGDMDHPDKIGLVAVVPVTVGVRDGRIIAEPDPVAKVGWRGVKTEMIMGEIPLTSFSLTTTKHSPSATDCARLSISSSGAERIGC